MGDGDLRSAIAAITLGATCKACGHQFPLAVLGLDESSEVNCPRCAHVAPLDGQSLEQIDAWFLEWARGLSPGLQEAGRFEPAFVRFLRLHGRFPSASELEELVAGNLLSSITLQVRITGPERVKRSKPEGSKRPMTRAARARREVPVSSGAEHFFAIDVETANPAYDSICQIGLVEFRDGSEVWSKSWLVDPEDEFDPFYTSIHGIDENKVEGAPTFDEVIEEVREAVGTCIVVCHTHFDRVALFQACDGCEAEPLDCEWLDSARVARRTWEHCAESGYGLANLAAFLGIKFQHHDALDDARTAGLILLRAIEHSGTPLEDWSRRIERPISPVEPIRRTGNDYGPLAGERIVFTGALTLARQDAANIADALGAAVDSGVTKHTSILVVGDQDVRKLNGREKSSKHLKAEQLIAKGKPIRILREADFMAFHALETGE